MGRGTVRRGMPRCRHCDRDLDVDALVSHETDGLLRVHCPECDGHLGTYRDPAGAPEPGA